MGYSLRARWLPLATFAVVLAVFFPVIFVLLAVFLPVLFVVLAVLLLEQIGEIDGRGVGIRHRVDTEGTRGQKEDHERFGKAAHEPGGRHKGSLGCEPQVPAN